MATPERAFSNPMAWWGVVQTGVAAGETTAQLFERIRAEAARTGATLPPGGAVAFNAIRSTAAQLRNASERLAAAPAGNAITAEHLAFLPYGKGPGFGAGPRQFDVRVGYTSVRTGVPATDYVTLRYTGGLPGSVGALREEASLVAAGLVESYSEEFTGMTSLQIGEL